MRIRPFFISGLFFVITTLLPTIAFSDTALDDPSSRLIVTVYEYRAEIAPSPNTSASEIVAQLLGGAKPVRTIRLPTLSGFQAQISAVERSEGRDEPVMPKIGTMLEVTAKRTSDSVLMEFSYEKTSLTTEDGPAISPRVKQLTVQSSYSFQLGEPVLVGGFDGFYLVATVTEATPGHRIDEVTRASRPHRPHAVHKTTSRPHRRGERPTASTR